jgi:hypothetical protein
MAIEVFNRYEIKYLLSTEQYAAVRAAVQQHMVADDYNAGGKPYNICNLYYDTPTDELVRRSLDKPVYKEKMRLRGYGAPSSNDTVYLEIKKKYNGKVNKRRTSFILSEAYNFIGSGIEPVRSANINHQVLSELEWFLRRYKLLPKVYITYDRFAFFERNHSDFRVTFDTNIKTRRTMLSLEAGCSGDFLTEKGTWLMEVKTADTIPLWFVHILSANRLYDVPFSKYGMEYTGKLNKSKEMPFYA